jgi:hypothetical protein
MGLILRRLTNLIIDLKLDCTEMCKGCMYIFYLVEDNFTNIIVVYWWG